MAKTFYEQDLDKIWREVYQSIETEQQACAKAKARLAAAWANLNGLHTTYADFEAYVIAMDSTTSEGALWQKRLSDLGAKATSIMADLDVANPALDALTEF